MSWCIRLLAMFLSFASGTAIADASCAVGKLPFYSDISAVYFRSEGVSEPLELRPGDAVRSGRCPVKVVIYVSATGAEKGGGPYCFKNSSGGARVCCGATESISDDASRLVFRRFVAVLAKHRFYDFAQSLPSVETDKVASYSIAVMRCGAQPKNDGAITFLGAPQAEANTSILTLRIPFGSAPGPLYEARLVALFEDFMRAIYQVQWGSEDIY